METIKLLIAIIGLAATIWSWWAKSDADKKKRQADEDAKIDKCANADDVLLELDRLSQKPTNRP